MYYIVNEADNRIVESQDRRPTDKELQGIADYMQCDVYVIQGEHAGLNASCGGDMVLIEDLDENDMLLPDDHPAFD